jgi:hypothetical protein
MAKLAETIKTGHQESESSKETTSKQITNRELYIINESNSTPELIRVMKYQTESNLTAIPLEIIL